MGRKLQTVLRLLSGPIPRGNESWRAKCPAHDDPSPSLNIDLDGDKILLHCMAGCSTAKVLGKLGLKWPDLFEDGNYSSTVREPGVSASGRTTASESLRHDVYSRLLRRLELSEDHNRHLTSRGLNQRAIRRHEYRTLTFLRGCRVAAGLHEEFGDELYSVPGFVQGLTGPRLTVREGLVIPVRGPGLSVVALQVRTGGPTAKYLWLSSRQVSIGSPVHWGYDYGAKMSMAPSEVRITEGPLKADVASKLDPQKIPTLAVPSVTQWKPILPVLAHSNPDRVRIAFDSDWHTNESVARAIRELGDYLSTQYEVVCEDWNPALGKGIDDLFLNGYEPRIITEDDLIAQSEGL